MAFKKKIRKHLFALKSIEYYLLCQFNTTNASFCFSRVHMQHIQSHVKPIMHEYFDAKMIHTFHFQYG